MLRRLPSLPSAGTAGRTLAGLAAASLLLVACGGGGDSSSDETVPTDADLVVRALDGIRWDAESYTAPAGEITVVFENASSLPHNLYILDADGVQLPTVLDLPRRGEIAVDTTIEAGTYTLICTIPGHGNMKATLTVG
jgi:plastocyanin